MRAIQGGETQLLALDFRTEFESLPDENGVIERKPFRVWGVIGALGVSRVTREDQHTFVNRRPVENRGITFALVEGYLNSLMKGRYTVCSLFIELDTADLDVMLDPVTR